MSKFYLVDECTYVSDYEWRGLSHILIFINFNFSCVYESLNVH